MIPAEFFLFTDLSGPACAAITGLFSSAGELAITLLAQGDEAPVELTGFQKILSNPLILPVGFFFLFYMTFILPERRRKAEDAKLMSALKKNDRVVTVGGIHGTVVATANESGVVTIRIDESSNTRIKVNRTAISTILKDPKENKETTSKESDAEAKD